MNKAYGLLVMLLAAACTSGAANTVQTSEQITISKDVWSKYQKYLTRVRSSHPGAFAVSKDGKYADYVWCSDMACIGQGYKNEALGYCERLSSMDCIVFAFGDDILVNYKIEG